MRKTTQTKNKSKFGILEQRKISQLRNYYREKSLALWAVEYGFKDVDEVFYMFESHDLDGRIEIQDRLLDIKEQEEAEILEIVGDNHAEYVDWLTDGWLIEGAEINEKLTEEER